METNDQTYLWERYADVRRESEWLCKPLEIDDYGAQTMPAVSPPKWHLAHTAWFFETLVLKPFLDGYREYHPLFPYLFNSYYESLGSYHPRPERGLLSRPTVAEVYRYRAYVDEHMARVLGQAGHLHREEIERCTVLGLNHEQQHQELLLTDIKHIFAYNPLRPSYGAMAWGTRVFDALPLRWLDFEGGIKSIGHEGEGFAYDNEAPVHKVYLHDFQLASRPVTNGEFMEFIEAGGYQKPDYWLSDAWKRVCQHGWKAPLYWECLDGEWWQMTLSGMRAVDEGSPVCHVSYYEAAAFAQWCGKRLPTEAEWEVAASTLPIEGNLRESGALHPLPLSSDDLFPSQMFGDVWEWTQSPYTPYPGFRQIPGPLGEYNGKFMSGQMVLRGGSCITPVDHIRATYRNFFYPEERWQFSGFRLAKDMR